MILPQPEHPLDKENRMWRSPYGIAVSDEEWNSFERRFNTILIDGYGLTETLGPATIMPIWGERRRGSVGFPHFGTEVKIVDDDRNEVPIGEKGEIAIKGQPGISLFKEYYKNPGATAEFLVDGWFYSEDYGRMDEDGYVYFVDRKKDIIKRAGENISSAEVERVLNLHPAIEESAIIGVPDPVRDEAVCAVIRLKERVNEQELTEFCKERMAKFKVPQFWIFRKEDFPKSSVGKIQKNILRRDILEYWKEREAKR
jgi:crotonobetaine/carnitine-CoA ligase